MKTLTTALAALGRLSGIFRFVSNAWDKQLTVRLEQVKCTVFYTLEIYANSEIFSKFDDECILFQFQFVAYCLDYDVVEFKYVFNIHLSKPSHIFIV